MSALASAAPQGWTLTGPVDEKASDIRGQGTRPVTLTLDEAQKLPVTLVVRARALTTPGQLVVSAVAADAAADAKPLILGALTRLQGQFVGMTASADGQPLPCVTRSMRTWSLRDSNNERVNYEPRFTRIGNLWEDRDRTEIGHDLELLTPIDEKLFVMRLVITADTRQYWVDDRLVSESHQPTRGPVKLTVTAQRGAGIESVEVRAGATSQGRFEMIALDDYLSDGRSRGEPKQVELKAMGTTVPVTPVSVADAEIPLARSLYRYRLTHGTGPDAPYVNAMRAWPTPWEVDPAEISFRVPYRDYQNVWLLVRVDEAAPGQPRGVVRFYRSQAGYPASSEFEVSAKTPRVTVPGQDQPVYLVKVPVDTAALYGFRDLSDQHLDLQITKPVALGRSYGDPIYYGYHPAGEASNLRILGITLEAAPFGVELIPDQYAHTFAADEPVGYTVRLTNHTDGELPVKLALTTTSYDEKETRHFATKQNVAGGSSADVKLALGSIGQFGWHRVVLEVTAGGMTRRVDQSLVRLMPDQRTYGNSDLETRFGSWDLWGHYTPFVTNPPANEEVLKLYRKIGVRRVAWHPSFIDVAMARKYDFLPKSAHTIVAIYHRLNEKDPEQVRKMLEDEWNQVAGILPHWPEPTYFYGGEWGFDHTYTHAANPRYTGEGPWPFDDKALANLRRQMTIFESIGRMMRQRNPNVKLILQWGGPQNTIPFLEQGFPRELVDGYGIDMPNFELTPEVPVAVGTVNMLWTVRQEIARTGWPQLGMHWCEGPFLPTNPGALSEQAQEQNQVRYWLMALAYGVTNLEAAMVPFEAGNYYGAEHYGAGVYHRTPLRHPKPAAAALHTAANLLCNAELVGPIDTGSTTVYGLKFRHLPTGESRSAWWTVRGNVDARINVEGRDWKQVNAMGQTTPLKVTRSKVTLSLSASPVWLIGAGAIGKVITDVPTHDARPAKVTRALPALTADQWSYDGSEDLGYAKNHHAVSRQTDPTLNATFGDKTTHGPAAVVTLPATAVDDRPLAARYGALVLKQPAVIPGKAAALGCWIDGNGSWGRVIYRLKDAKGETWTSIGDKDNWNCDDIHTWSYVNFTGWRYVTFPLPGNHPWDASRELETTWWKCEGGDGIVDLPLSLERVIVEARNAVHVLGRMTVVPDRDYRIAGLEAVYEDRTMADDAVLDRYARRMPTPGWRGPEENAIAKMRAEGNEQSPAIKGFEEPHHWNDGRRMIIHFDGKADRQYQVWLSRFEDGRGAEPLRGFYKDGSTIVGLRPDTEMFLFLVEIGADKKPQKPSAPVRLVTKDKFAEK